MRFFVQGLYMDILEQIDNSKNMEDLRGARSFNALVTVLSRIKSSILSIKRRVVRNLSQPTVETVEIGILDEFGFCVHPELKKAVQDLHNILCFHYEVQFSRSMTHVVAGTEKIKKFRLITENLDNDIVDAQNLLYKYLDNIGTRIEPQKLSEYAKAAENLLAKSLAFTKQTTFCLPSLDDKVSFSRYLILHNVRSTNDYVMRTMLVCIHAINNQDNTFSYAISFPSSVGDSAVQKHFINKTQMTSALYAHLETLFRVSDIKSIQKAPTKAIETIEDVISVTFERPYLCIHLESGVTGSVINNILTKVLRIAHPAFGVEDSKSDIIHSVSTSERGNKTIKIAVADRNFYDSARVRQLKKALSMKESTYKEVLNELEATNA